MAARERSFLRDHALTLACLGLFFVFLFGQSLAGNRSYNQDQRDHKEPAVSYGEYLTTGHFVEAVFENWESEFLQMGSYVLLAVWLRQRDSPESKPMDEEDPSEEPPEPHQDDPDAPWPVRRGGVALALYKHSLSAAFFGMFFLSWALHAAGGAREFSAEQLSHGGQPVSFLQYTHTAQFWSESLQNWQSEFLAVGLIVLLSVYLREQGSPESKAVADPVHAD